MSYNTSMEHTRIAAWGGLQECTTVDDCKIGLNGTIVVDPWCMASSRISDVEAPKNTSYCTCFNIDQRSGPQCLNVQSSMVPLNIGGNIVSILFAAFNLVRGIQYLRRRKTRRVNAAMITCLYAIGTFIGSIAWSFCRMTTFNVTNVAMVNSVRSLQDIFVMPFAMACVVGGNSTVALAWIDVVYSFSSSKKLKNAKQTLKTVMAVVMMSFVVFSGIFVTIKQFGLVLIVTILIILAISAVYMYASTLIRRSFSTKKSSSGFNGNASTSTSKLIAKTTRAARRAMILSIIMALVFAAAIPMTAVSKFTAFTTPAQVPETLLTVFFTIGITTLAANNLNYLSTNKARNERTSAIHAAGKSDTLIHATSAASSTAHGSSVMLK